MAHKRKRTKATIFSFTYLKRKWKRKSFVTVGKTWLIIERKSFVSLSLVPALFVFMTAGT